MPASTAQQAQAPLAPVLPHTNHTPRSLVQDFTAIQLDTIQQSVELRRDKIYQLMQEEEAYAAKISSLMDDEQRFAGKISQLMERVRACMPWPADQLTRVQQQAAG